MIKRLVCILLSAFLAVSFAGCSNEQKASVQKAFDSKLVPQLPNETKVTENENFILSLNPDTKGIILTEKATGNVWGTSPKESDEIKLDEWGDPVTRHPQVESALFVEYVSAQTGNTDLVISKTGALKNGRINCRKIESGIRVEHYFDEVGFMIPVDYILRSDSVLVTVNPNEIQESDNKIVSISVAPFWCAAENDLKDSYLFVPSGSGALIYPQAETQQGTNWSSPVYGNDPTIEVWDSPTTEKAVRLPCYGVKAGSTAVLAIIENGAESAEINVSYGSKALGYSSVYASFVLRGYTNNIADLMPGERVKNLIYSDYMIETPLSIGFYPLMGEKANYSGMASGYKAYLTEKFNMPNDRKDSPVNVNIIGGVMISKSFLGVPYKTLFSATTAGQAKDIAEKLVGAGITPSLRLTGFGQNGISVGKLAGGFKVASDLGGTDGINKLADYCKKQEIDTYLDFDLINFSSGSAGFSPLFDSALCASRKIAYMYDFDIAARGRKEDSRYNLLSRASLLECAEILFEKTKNLNISGYSLSTLSNIAYSDYSNRGNSYSYSKGNMSADTGRIFALTEKNILVSDANAYAAAMADVIFDAPTASSQSDIFDEDIPFYEIVFKGAVALSCESINLATDAELQILKAIEGGCGLNYTVICNYDNVLLDTQSKSFYNSHFGNICDDMLSAVSEISDYYNKIDGAGIVNHSILENGLRLTEFDNGTTVYVNYGDADVSTPFGNVLAKGYLIGGDGSAQG